MTDNVIGWGVALPGEGMGRRFVDWVTGTAAAARATFQHERQHHKAPSRPVLREAFIEDAAMRREMYRL
jgi:hypothetical protein